MSKLEIGDNPTVFGGQTVPDEKGRIEMPPEKSIEGIAPSDVRRNPLNIQMGPSFKFAKINGKICRIGENGVKYPPISEKKYQEILNARNKSRENRDEGMTH